MSEAPAGPLRFRPQRYYPVPPLQDRLVPYVKPRPMRALLVANALGSIAGVIAYSCYRQYSKVCCTINSLSLCMRGCP